MKSAWLLFVLGAFTMATDLPSTHAQVRFRVLRKFQSRPTPKQFATPGQAGFQSEIPQSAYGPSRYNLRDNDLQDFIEDAVQRRFRRMVSDVDVDVNNRGYVKVEIQARDYGTFFHVRNFILGMPQLAGYRVYIVCDNLEELIENRIEHAFRHWINDVDVDVDHDRRCIELEVEFRHPLAHGQLRSFLASMPELAGYRLRLEVEYDD